MRVRPTKVAVLGAGIMGSSVALFLARAGVHVTLFDAATAPLSRASRWNEGKIHLGYLYSGDRSQDTVHTLLPGGLAFRATTEELIGCRIPDTVITGDDIYLVHRNSVVSHDAMQAHYKRVAELARSNPYARGSLSDLSHAAVRRLSQQELREVADTEEIVAGYQVPERSIRTNWIADRLVEALRAEPAIELAMNTRVRSLESSDPAREGEWSLQTDPLSNARFDAVVNALWEGSLAVDRRVGLAPPGPWSHRLRLSLFVRTSQVVDAPSAVIATGPFGDVKNFGGRDFYLSWYDAGLIAEGDAIDPPAVPPLGAKRKQEIESIIFKRLGTLLPSVRRITEAAEEIKLEGGWVFAIGQGKLDDPHATLHRRDRLGIRELGTYLSVNTGKYSVAPWLARQVADRILGRSAE